MLADESEEVVHQSPDGENVAGVHSCADNFEPDLIILKRGILGVLLCTTPIGTAGIGIMGLFSARLVHSFLCSIYGVKNDSSKNMP